MSFLIALGLGLFSASMTSALEVGTFTLKQDVKHKALYFSIHAEEVISELMGATSVQVEPTTLQNFKQTILTFRDARDQIVARAYQRFFTRSYEVTLEDAENNVIGKVIDQKLEGRRIAYLSISNPSGAEELKGYSSSTYSGQSKFYFKKSGPAKFSDNVIQLNSALNRRGVTWTAKVIEEVEVSPLMIAAFAVFETQNRIIQYYINTGKKIGYAVGTAAIVYISYKLFKRYKNQQAEKLLAQQNLENARIAKLAEEAEKERLDREAEVEAKKALQAEKWAKLDAMLADLDADSAMEGGGVLWAHGAQGKLTELQDNLKLLSNASGDVRENLLAEIDSQIYLVNKIIQKTKHDAIDAINQLRGGWVASIGAGRISDQFPLLDVKSLKVNQGRVSTLLGEVNEMINSLQGDEDKRTRAAMIKDIIEKKLRSLGY